jgi:SAM-dependent methyltransferase
MVSGIEEQARDSMKAGRPADALVILTSALGECESSRLCNDWARLAFSCGDSSLAEFGYRRALRLETSHREAAVSLTTLLLGQGRLDESIPVLQSLAGRLTEVEKRFLRELATHPQANNRLPIVRPQDIKRAGKTFRKEKPANPLKFTGERFTSDISGQIEIEHLHRYLVARDLCRDKDVLDVASGEGYGTAMLAQVARTAIGIEIDSATVAHANEAYVRPNLKFIVGDARRLPIPTASVDVLTSFETLEHIVEQEDFLDEMRRVLRPNGFVLISTPDREVYSFLGNPPNPFHPRELSREEFLSVVGVRFPHVQLFMQRPLTGSALVSDLTDQSNRPIVTYEKRNENYIERNEGLPYSPYLIACGSALPIEGILGPSIYIETSAIDLPFELMRRALASEQKTKAELAVALTVRDSRGELEKGQRKVVIQAPLFCAPGHFYSPIVDPNKAALYLERKALSPVPDSLPGLTLDRATMRSMWQKLLPYLVSAPFTTQKSANLRYCYENPNYSYGDGSVLHAMLRQYRPKRVIEVGGGWSSACTVDTAEMFLDGKCDLTFIEPYPDPLKSALGSPKCRVKFLAYDVQQTPLEAFDELEANDFLFIDSTHVLSTGSDVCFELFDILPRLKPGVLVHFHDIFWPFEYPRKWVVDENRSWNELYAIRAFMTNNQEWEIVFFNDYFSRFEEKMVAETFPLFLKNPGGALWLVRKGAGD